MRIRAKSARLGVAVEHEVLEESYNFYITSFKEVLSKQDYEPVPTERWVDVTAHCVVLDGGRAYINDGAIVDLPFGYRLRKMKACDLLGPLNDVFIVERKESI